MQNVKQKMTWLWQNAEKILIVIFFATFTLNIRKVFLTPYSFLNGGFNEYGTLSFSWEDLLMLATISIYTIKYIISQVINPYYASPGYGKAFEKSFYNVSRETFFLLLFLAWVGLSIFWSQFRPIAAYKFLTLAEIAFFATIAVKSLKNGRWLKIALFALIINGIFQSLVGITQFIHNGSLGLHAIGESLIAPNIDGVAKIMLNGEKHIRAYGTLPHPNMLAGFLLIPFFLLLTEYISRLKKVSHETLLYFLPVWFLLGSGFLIGLGFILTFSRSAILALAIGLAIFLWQIKIVGHKPSWDRPVLQKLGLFIILASVTLLLLHKTSFFSDQSLKERSLYQIVSYETIQAHPFQGVGIGQFVINSYYTHPNFENWQYQPVHNIFLLIFSELGITGLVLFSLALISVFLRACLHTRRGINYNLTVLVFCCILFSFLAISFFDHYFWDIKLGTMVFVLPVIFAYASLTEFQTKISS